VSDRAGPDDVRPHLDAVALAQRPGLLEGRLDARGDVGRQLALHREAAGNPDDGDRLHLHVVRHREGDRGRDQLLADVAELHRDENAPKVVSRRRDGWLVARVLEVAELAREEPHQALRRSSADDPEEPSSPEAVAESAGAPRVRSSSISSSRLRFRRPGTTR
jgi:hypothetical protein